MHCNDFYCRGSETVLRKDMPFSLAGYFMLVQLQVIRNYQCTFKRYQCYLQ